MATDKTTHPLFATISLAEWMAMKTEINDLKRMCQDNYNAGMKHAMEIVLNCPDETPPVEVFRAIQAELKS